MAYTVEMTEEHPFHIYYDDESQFSLKNNQFSTEILFQLPEGGYLYKKSLRLTTENPEVEVQVHYPEAKVKYDEFMEEDVEVYYHEVILPVTLTLPASFSQTQVNARLFYQGCANKICYRTMKLPLTFAVQVVTQTDGKRIQSNQSQFVKSQKPVQKSDKSFLSLFKINDFQEVLDRGLWVAVVLTFLAGVVTGFTPCVLPVIPLTLAFMGVSTGQRKKTRLISLLIFVLGLIAMYSTLGVLSAVLGKTLGFWFQSLAFQIFLILFFLLMGLWMFGVLNFSIPAKWQNQIVRVQPKGHLKHLYSGLTIGFLAAPCVGPIVGPLLVYISLSRDIIIGFGLMASYAIGLSVLFFILGFFSRDWIARFGEKSYMVKKLLGSLLILTAVFYSYVLARPYFADASQKDDFFITNYQQAIQKAQGEQKGVLIDFYADWCLPCHEWDKNVWSDAKTQKKIDEDFVPLKIDCTKETKECSEVVEKFGVIGWPTIIFLDKTQKELKEFRLVGQVMSAEEFQYYLRELNKQ